MQRIRSLRIAACLLPALVHAQVAITPIPGIIQAEDYDAGGAGVSYFDTSPGNTGGAYRTDDVDIESSGSAANGHNVGWIGVGEWLAYTISVETADTFSVRYRVASNESGPFTIELRVNGLFVDTIEFNGTGGWQNWTDETSGVTFELEPGEHAVRLDFLSQEFNLDEFEIISTTPPEPPLYLDPTATVADRVEDLLARMTLDEKIGQMTQANIGALGVDSDIRSYRLGSLLSAGGEAASPNTAEAWADMTDGYQNYALSTPLKIPLLYGTDAVHGHNNLYGATIFPHNIGLGATRNAELVKAAAEITAIEVAATGAHWTFAPALSVARNEHWGRTYESVSEDTDLVAELSAAAIRGFQGDDLTASTSIIACAKHFAGDGGTNAGIDQGNTVLDEATFRALHIAPYIDAIAAGVETIMVSFSSWNGLKMHGHEYMLTTVLKEEMGFEGFLVSDWAGVDQVDPDYATAVSTSVNAGIDMVMVPNQYINFIQILKAAVQSGDVPLSRIDDAVRRILGVKFRAGLFEDPYASRELLPLVGSASHRAVARQAVSESLVVLKDDSQLLPLAKNLPRIHVAGKNADDLGHQCGGWSISWQGSSGPITIGTTILDAIEATVHPTTTVTYSLTGSGAAGADVGIVVVGETPYAEGQGDRTDLRLAAADINAINTVRAAGVPVIVILVSGRPMYIEDELPDWDAFIAAWLPGTEGQGVADVLFGDTFPVGILSHSWPRDGAAPVNLGDANYNPLFPYGYSVHVDGDRDADTLPDRWEALYGLNPYDDGSTHPQFGATGDLDGDGGSNRFELETGTNPQLAASLFRIVGMQPGLSDLELTVTTVPGFQYHIEIADSDFVSPENWSPFLNQADGVGTWLEDRDTESTFTFRDDYSPATSGSAPTEGRRFYRVRVVDP
jgi:beta-glucosidase